MTWWHGVNDLDDAILLGIASAALVAFFYNLWLLWKEARRSDRHELKQHVRDFRRKHAQVRDFYDRTKNHELYDARVKRELNNEGD